MSTIAYTGGTFDMFHSGHVNLLKRCSLIADEVVVALNTDEFIESYKGSKPVISYEDRKTVLESCRYVSWVVENSHGSDSKPTISSVEPDFIVIGSDWASKDYHAQLQVDSKWLDDNEITLLYVPYTEEISSTDIRSRLQ